MQKIKYVVLSTLFLSLGVFTSCNKTASTDVMIVGVNDYADPDFNEVAWLKDHLEGLNTIVIDDINFYTGKIDNKNIVIAESPVGMPQSAVTAAIGVKSFHPKYVISEGTSGGHSDDKSRVSVNDIILGETILDVSSYHGDIYDLDDPEFELLQPPLSGDKELLKKINDKFPDFELDERVYHVNSGVISSANCWNTGVEFIKALHKRFNDDCEEMESYAVAYVCDYFKIPMIPIRIISNNAMLGEEGEFDPEAGTICQKFVYEVVKTI